MDPLSDLEPGARPRDAEGTPPAPRRRLLSRLRPIVDALVLWLHRRADRMDLIPAEFGDATPVDERDAGSVAREWLRQARLWASYNPEEMLALKAGAVALGIALVVLIALVGAIR